MLQGSMVALITPMNDDGSLDRDSYANLIEWHIENGTDAIVSMGTTGESATLSMDEHCQVLRWAVDITDGRIPVIAGSGANSTSEAIELTQCAKDVGADAALLVTPYYNKPTQDGLYLHFKAIAEAVAIDQILYNVPGRTACDMKPETIGRLSGISNIVGVKEATGELDRVQPLRELCGDDFGLYSGDDGTGMEFMLLGGNGVISVTNNVAPKAMSDMCKAALAGDRSSAEAINEKLDALHNTLFCESNPIPVKWAMHDIGKITGSGIRLPLTPLSSQHHESLRAAISQAAQVS